MANTVAVRPGFPMLLAEMPGAGTGGRSAFVAGLPGNPQSAIVALVSLVIPLLHGLTGRPAPRPGRVTLAAPIPGRGDFTHLALVRHRRDGLAEPLAHAGSAMLRGLARADGFAVIAPGTSGQAGDQVDFVPLPLTGRSAMSRDARRRMMTARTALTDRAAGRGRARGRGRRIRPPARWCRSPAWSATTTAAGR